MLVLILWHRKVARFYGIVKLHWCNIVNDVFHKDKPINVDVSKGLKYLPSIINCLTWFKV